MSILETDWQSLLSVDSDLPPDVIFVIEGERVRAHKLLLAGVSPVFKGMFYGPMKETAEEIVVEETTFEAFDTMVKYIYQPQGGESWAGIGRSEGPHYLVTLRHGRCVGVPLQHPSWGNMSSNLRTLCVQLIKFQNL